MVVIDGCGIFVGLKKNTSFMYTPCLHILCMYMYIFLSIYDIAFIYKFFIHELRLEKKNVEYKSY